MTTVIVRFKESEKDGGAYHIKEYDVPSGLPNVEKSDWAKNLWKQDYGQSDCVLLSISL